MVEGHSKQAFKTWLADRDQVWRDQVQVVTMDGFTGFKTAATEELPEAVTVMDPFHVVRLAGDALDTCRRRIQVTLHGSRGRKHHPLYQNRRTLHTGIGLLTDKQKDRLGALFGGEHEGGAALGVEGVGIGARGEQRFQVRGVTGADGREEGLGRRGRRHGRPPGPSMARSSAPRHPGAIRARAP